jgi:tetratricopeptide (TPR) repeat protein
MRALELEPDLPEAYVRFSAIQRSYDWDWKGAEQSIRRALELAPASAEALASAGSLAQVLCRFDEAEALLRRAVEQDPLGSTAYMSLGHLYRARLRLPEAEQAYRKGLELAPQRVGGHSIMGIVLAEQGKLPEALAVAETERAEWARLTALAYVHHVAGRREASDEALRALQEGHARDSGYQLAAVHAVRGEFDEAFEWLERSYQERDSGLALAKAEPVFRALHGDPRWAAIMNKIGLGD